MISENVLIQKLFKQLCRTDYEYFPESGGVKITENQGVYIIYSPEGDVLHVGRTHRAKKGLNQRLYNHLSNRSSFSIEYLKNEGFKLRQGYKFKYLVVPDGRQRALLEALTAGKLCPAHIGTGE